MVKNKSGQVTIFIILALIIIVGVALVITFFPKIKSGISTGPKNPQEYLDTCLRETLEKNIETISLHGGSLNPQSSYLYDNYELEYLCYTNEYYKTCTVQIPFLRTHIEKEIKKSVEGEIDSCLNSMKESYENKGYNIILKKGTSKVELLPKRIVLTINSSMTLTKQNSETYENFRIILNNNLFEMVGIAESIVEWESAYGTAEPSFYMDIYHDLLVHKKTQSDETTVYIIEDINNGNKFQFASRSLAFPPGYGQSPAYLTE